MTVPFPQWIDEARTSTGWTPDVPRLEQQDFWPVFVYGKRRGKHSDFFKHDYSRAKFVSIGWTKSKIYSILNVETDLSKYQLATPFGVDQILGEMWLVPPEMMYELDCEERNLVVSKRIAAPVEVGSGKVINSWIYLADPSFLASNGIKITKLTTSTYIGTKKYLEII